MVLDVYLVPGFFGFANLGDFRYFGHVRAILLERFGGRGVDVRVHEVPTPPTAGLARRAAKLASHIQATARPEAELALVGHSSGGLDIRLLLSVGVRLPTEVDVAAIAGRVRAAVTLATPHRGAPLAKVLVQAQGQRALEILSLSAMSVIRRGRVPLEVLTLLAGDLAAPMVPAGLPDQLYRELLGAFTPDRQEEVGALLRQVAADPTLLHQISPEPMAVIDALATVPDTVLAGSVVTAARPPGMGSRIEAGLSPGRQASRLLYGRLHSLASRFATDRRPVLTAEWRSALQHAGEPFTDPDANDGMVPTVSQPWGEIIACCCGDHLDVIGHFDAPDGPTPHHDWLFTGSGMNRARFEAVYEAVAAFLVR